MLFNPEAVALPIYVLHVCLVDTFCKWLRLDVLKIEHCKTKEETGFYKTWYLYDDAAVTRSKCVALEQAQSCENNLLKFRYGWRTNAMLPLKKQVCHFTDLICNNYTWSKKKVLNS
jgi:hypothetical protein